VREDCREGRVVFALVAAVFRPPAFAVDIAFEFAFGFAFEFEFAFEFVAAACFFF